MKARVLGSAVVYAGLVLAIAGAALVVRPSRRLAVPTRSCAALVVLAGFLLAGIGIALPAPESRAGRIESLLDEFMPAWQFHERHARRIAAPPARVFDAILRVRADEILLFRTLTWIRRGGRRLRPNILDAAGRDSLIDVATRTTFLRLAEEAPRELVVGTVIAAPPGPREPLSPGLFLPGASLRPGYALATMNFRVRDDGAGGSLVTTETRVFANSPAARRRFAAYWRVIYPGSSLIRRMWLRAIDRRATDPSVHESPAGARD